MTLSIVPGLEEGVGLINCFGTLNASGTTWSIDAEHLEQWSVKTTQNAIRARYGISGIKLIVR